MTAAATTEASSRDVILDVAERLMTTAGYDKTSISQICSESGLPVGSLYHHFGSKSGLLAAVTRRVERRFFGGLPLLDETTVDPDQGFAEFWSAAIDGLLDNYAYFTLDVELVRLSHDDSELRELLDAQTVSSRALIANALTPFARLAGVPDPGGFIGGIARSIVTFSRGAILVAGSDRVAFRREMEGFYPFVHDMIVAAGHPEAAARLKSHRA